MAGAATVNPSVFGPDPGGPAAEPIRRPLGVTPARTGHALGVRAVLPEATLAAPDGAREKEFADAAAFAARGVFNRTTAPAA
jgi:hypothetical protein